MPNQLPEFQSQVNLSATTSPVPYVENFSAMALTPDLLGQLGSTIATSASSELARRRGLEAGLNPTGDVLPPLTSADKAFVDAYQNQAHATLSNQGQDVINKADEALSKLNKIQPSDIVKYKSTVQSSLEDIIKLAPNEAKVSLFNSFNQQITSSVHNYNTRLISQQKSEQKSNADLALNTLTQNVHDALLSGDNKNAELFLNNQIEQINKGINSGLYTNAQGISLKKSAQLNYLTGVQINEGIKAHDKGQSDQWLKGLVDPKKKPKNINWSDWETVADNSRKYLANRESFTKSAAQVLASNGYLDIANNSMTADKLADYQEKLKDEPLLFNNLAIAYAHMNKTSSSKAQRLNEISANWQNMETMKMASNEEINRSFSYLSDLYQKQQQAMGNPISKDEADFITAASAVVPVPKYTESLQRLISSGIPGNMTSGIHYYNRLKELPGNKAAGFLSDSKAVAMKGNFQNAIDEGKSEEEAANIAQEIWNNKDKPDVVAFIKSQTDLALNKFSNTTPNSYQWARNKLNIPNNVHVENMGALAGEWRSHFITAMQYTNGNVSVSEKMASEGISKTFGQSEINGVKNYMQFPPEKMTGLGKGAVPLMQEDLYQQIKPMIEFSKKVYDTGAQPFYYEISDHTDYQTYLASKKNLQSKGLRDETYAKDKQIVNKFESGQPLTIKKIFHNKEIKEYTTYLQSNPNQSLDIKTGDLMGGYDIGLINYKTGERDSLFGVFPNGNTHLSWKPNTEWIKNNYLAVNGLVPKNSDTLLQEAQQYLSNTKPGK